LRLNAQAGVGRTVGKRDKADRVKVKSTYASAILSCSSLAPLKSKEANGTGGARRRGLSIDIETPGMVYREVEAH
jgi:hypothetical protein